MRVFAVDDEHSILELLSEALPVLGCDDVNTASSAQEALDLLTAEQLDIDCFLLDIQMPLIDGIALCGRIRQIDRYAQTPIIMLTAMSEKAYVDQAFQVGATDYLTKPFDMAELSTRLQLAIKHRKVDADSSAPKAIAAETTQVDEEAPENVDRVISLTAFENYVLQLTRARLVTAGLFAIKIPEMHEAGKSLPEAEVARWELLLSKAISQATMYDQSVISYAGQGCFLVLNKSWGTNKREVLLQSIIDIFEELDTQTHSAEAKRPTIVVGDVVSLPAFGRAFTLAYLHKAIRRAEDLCQTEPEPKKRKKRFARRRDKDVQTREYKKMLGDLIEELDPLAAQPQRQKTEQMRAGGSPLSPPPLRNAV